MFEWKKSEVSHGEKRPAWLRVEIGSVDVDTGQDGVTTYTIVNDGTRSH